MWVSLEAVTGWGKTRILQELYKRLAAERQTSGAYWPPSIRGSAVSDSDRKRLFPEVVEPELEAVPAFFWWGVTCSDRSGVPTQALAQDASQFRAHRAGLEGRWRRDAPARDRLARWSRGVVREVGPDAASDLVGAGLQLLDLAFPAVGTLLKIGTVSVRTAYKRKRLPSVIDATNTGRQDLVDEIGAGLLALSRSVLPIVIAIEDAHLADPSLVELLKRLAAAHEAKVLIITTSWPGFLEEPERALSAMLDGVPVERQLRYGVASSIHPERRLRQLTTADLLALARHLLADAPQQTLDALVLRFSTPLSLGIACSLASLRGELQAGRLGLDVIEGTPDDLELLLRRAFDELPERTRFDLKIAALCIPAVINPGADFPDVRWDRDVFGLAVEAITELAPIPTTPRAGAALDDIAGADAADAKYGWVGVGDTTLRSFPEPLQREIVSELSHRPTFVPRSARRQMYEQICHALNNITAQARPQIASRQSARRAARRGVRHLGGGARQCPRSLDIPGGVF